MRTTVDIPESLLAEAQRAAGAKTKTATLIIALQELISRRKIQKLRRLRGRIDLDVDLGQLRKHRIPED